MADDSTIAPTSDDSGVDETDLFVVRKIGTGADAPPKLPQLGTRYRITSEIARGGMGIVFAACDLALNREVAVKILRDELRDRPDIADRFLEEAQITGQLQHPGIPPVHDLGSLADGRLFMAMKLIAGRTLSTLLHHDRPDTPRLLHIFERIAETVAFAHAQGVIHRDLKPSNVMVGRFGEVQVMDWGLAKVLERPADGTPASDAGVLDPSSINDPPVDSPDSGVYTPHSHPTEAGSVLGTPAYMPPEQAQGHIETVDARADVFALGSILCEMLTGEPPYVGTRTVVRALAMTGQTAPALARLDGCGADPELIALARRCLSANAVDRPLNADVVARAVATYQTGVADRLRKAEVEQAQAVVRQSEARKRRRVQLALVAAAVLFVLGGVAVAWWQDRQAGQRRAIADRVADRTREAVTSALSEAETALRADDLPTVDAALARARGRLGDAGPDDLRDRLASLTRDADMIEGLEFLLDARPTGRRGGMAENTDSPKDYVEVFRRYGLDLRAGDVEEMTTRIASSPIRTQLVAGLDAALGRYGFSAFDIPPMLPALLRHVDGDPVRSRVRDAMVARATRGRLALVRELDPAHLTPGFAALIGQQFDLPEADRLRVLSAAAEQHPGDFRLHELLCLLHLGSSLGASGKLTPEAIAAADTQARILIAIRPSSPDGYRIRGQVLRRADRFDEAIAAWSKAADLTRAPEEAASIKSQIGNVIRKQQGPEAAIRYFRGEVERAPADAYAHANLGRELLADENLVGAAACLRTAIDLRPTEGNFYQALARVFVQQGDWTGAVQTYRQAAERARPRVFSHTAGLCQVLVTQQRYREAVEAQEHLLADFPVPARSSETRIRHEAACAAARAGTLGGTDPYPSDRWPAVRRKALNWLREDLPRWQNELALNPDKYRAGIHERLRQLLGEPALTSLRHPLLLAALPPDEALAWLAFWDEVHKLHDATSLPLDQ